MTEAVTKLPVKNEQKATGFWRSPFRRASFDIEPFWQGEATWGTTPAVDIVEKDNAFEVVARGHEKQNPRRNRNDGTLVVFRSRRTVQQAAAIDRPIFRGWLLAICGATAVFITAAGLLVQPTAAQAPQCLAPVPNVEQPPQLCSLVGQTPLPPTLNGQDLVAAGIIANRQRAQQLGKALFWDIQIGSDGQACASCHFHAGADIRIANQANPGLNAVNPDFTFSTRRNPANGPTGPNKTLSADDFPFRQLTDVNNRNSVALYDSNDRFSSQGTYAGDFVHPQPIPFTPTATSVFTGDDKCIDTYDPAGNPFHSNGLIRRKVEPRQTPSAINAVFNLRQFWDGRANNQFNGVDPFGPRTFQPLQNIAPVGLVGNPNAAGAGVLVNSTTGLVLTKPLIDNSSLASQAVGPPRSDFEMSCTQRAFADIGRKMLTRTALALQKVDPHDSLFSLDPTLLSNNATGLNFTYSQLITRAFAPIYSNSPQLVTIDPATGAIMHDPNGFLQAEHNFAFFFGLAVQEYEALLISDQSPFDTGVGFTAAAQAGQAVFTGAKAKCVNCHRGPLLSAATRTQQLGAQDQLVEHMLMGDGNAAFYDQGFYNIGVRPTPEDLGVGRKDPYGFDLSFSRQYKWRLLGNNQLAPDKFNVNACAFPVPFTTAGADCLPQFSGPTDPQLRDAVDGAFKTPTLRNVGLTPPYFHHGGQATLADVVRFYNRGGDRQGNFPTDTTGFGPTPFGVTNGTNLDPDIGNLSDPNSALGLTDVEQANLVAFLLSLTDNRVACHQGPFDHPQLPIPNGHQEVAISGMRAVNNIAVMPAVGNDGLQRIGKPCFPNNGSLFGDLQTTFAIVTSP